MPVSISFLIICFAGLVVLGLYFYKAHNARHGRRLVLAGAGLLLLLGASVTFSGSTAPAWITAVVVVPICFWDVFAKRSALHLAAMAGEWEEVIVLIEHGADLNAVDSDGMTPLMAAVVAGQVETALELIRQGVDVNVSTDSGWTALHAAARRGDTEVVRALCDAGVDVNARVTEKLMCGMTPLHLAGTVATASALLAAGADPSAVDDGWATPVDTAASTEIAEILRNQGGRPGWRLKTVKSD